MVIVYVVVTIVTIAANAFYAVADLGRREFVLRNSASVGVPPSWLTTLGLLKGAGAAGLLLGLLGVPLIGIAAAIGLVLFFVGAIVAHVRARQVASMAFPATMFLLAAATLLLDLTT